MGLAVRWWVSVRDARNNVTAFSCEEEVPVGVFSLARQCLPFSFLISLASFGLLFPAKRNDDDGACFGTKKEKQGRQETVSGNGAQCPPPLFSPHDPRREPSFRPTQEDGISIEYKKTKIKGTCHTACVVVG